MKELICLNVSLVVGLAFFSSFQSMSLMKSETILNIKFFNKSLDNRPYRMTLFLPIEIELLIGRLQSIAFFFGNFVIELHARFIRNIDWFF